MWFSGFEIFQVICMFFLIDMALIGWVKLDNRMPEIKRKIALWVGKHLYKEDWSNGLGLYR